MTAQADFKYQIGRYNFQWSSHLAQTPLAGQRFLVLEVREEEHPVYETGAGHPVDWIYTDIYSWRVEGLDHEVHIVVYEVEGRMWFTTPEEAIADFEATYFTEVIEEDPI